MELIINLINELQTTNYIFIPASINEINKFVLNKLYQIIDNYKLTYNKYHIFEMITTIGLELENTFQINKITNNNIISQQLNFYSNLVNPIISKIRSICLELNLELVEDAKNKIFNLINLNPNKYSEVQKYIKFMQINCFCRNINYVVGKEVMFWDFGITIKITNSHYKNIFKDLIEETKLFVSNDNNKDKRFDWYWKTIEQNNINSINVISDKIIKQHNNFFNTNDFSYTNNEKNIENTINTEITENIENTENFKIIQTQPENVLQPQDIKLTDKINIIKNISNLIIIEDDSFTIPIELEN